MDSLFNIGFPELIFILVLAGLFMGPQRIRQVARYLGRLTARLQAISREFTRQLNAELDAAERGEIKAALADIRQLQAQVAELRRDLAAAPQALRQEAENVVRKPAPAAPSTPPSSPVDNNTILPPRRTPTPDELELHPQDIAGRPPVSLPQPVDVLDDPEA